MVPAAAARAAELGGDRRPCCSPIAAPGEVAEPDKQQRAGPQPLPRQGRPHGQAGGRQGEEEEPGGRATASAAEPSAAAAAPSGWPER